MGAKVIDVTFVSDTSILAVGDVITDTVEIPNATIDAQLGSVLDSITIIDEDDQGTAVDVVILRSNVSLGTKNSAPNISDANGREILHTISVAAADFKDYGGLRVATKNLLGLIVKPITGTSLYSSLICQSGTPTYTASGLKGRFGLIQS